MRWSKALIPTLKETPADAVAPSHVLLLRAGMIRQLGAGAYTYLPLGFRVLNKVVRIVREEMDAAGALELLMPALQPIELWKESGRFETFGDLLMKLTLSGSHQMALGPTHEEVITDLVRDLIRSYKQLPITLYQIQTKFRDEPRPRFGILRTREFLMKDAYSFDADVEQLNASYDAMYEAYCRIFDRCGIPYVVVEAESGPIGGDASHEFMVPCSTGEDAVIQCEQVRLRRQPRAGRDRRPDHAIAHARPRRAGLQGRADPGKRTIQEVCEFLKVDGVDLGQAPGLSGRRPAGGRPDPGRSRGERGEGPPRLRRHGARPGRRGDDREGHRGPDGLPRPGGHQDPAGRRPRGRRDADVVVGGNEIDVHLKGVVPGRDFPLDRCSTSATPGAATPARGAARRWPSRGNRDRPRLQARHQVFQGDGGDLPRRQGERDPVIMGCYGIGVNRIVAARRRGRPRRNGIVWPLALAPYEVLLVPLQLQNPAVMERPRPSSRPWRRPASTSWWTTATSGPASSSRTPT